MDIYDFRARGTSRLDYRTEALAEAIIGAAIEVHRHLGPGVSEVSYKLSLSHELTLRGIPHACEVPVSLTYKGLDVGTVRLDMLVDGLVIVELKAVEALNQLHRAQAITYLQITKLQLALLINFNVPLLKNGIKRVINTF
jgi:GxxExxY protein